MTNAKRNIPQPFLKWAGGKRSILSQISPMIPEFTGRYLEPFLGAGAIFFSIDAQKPKIVSDFNVDLIEVYEVIRDSPTELLQELAKHANNQDHYLKVRELDRTPNFRELHPIVRASRFIYLNKTCFNGLYRVNRNGHFNVPFGRQSNPDYISTENIQLVSKFLNTPSRDGSKPTLLAGDYRETTALANIGDFVYFDPPYDPVSRSSSFVSYQKTGFSRTDQTELRDEALRLTSLGVPVLLSNSDTEFIRAIYADSSVFEINSIQVNRAIGASASSRGKVGELLIANRPALEKSRAK